MGAYRVYSVEVIIQAFQAWARGSNPRARIESFCAGERALHAREQAEPPADAFAANLRRESALL